jgi:hypothetical protein
MYNHPHLNGELARERQREILATAERQHLLQQCRIQSTQPGRPARSLQWLRQALRITTRPGRVTQA